MFLFFFFYTFCCWFKISGLDLVITWEIKQTGFHLAGRSLRNIGSFGVLPCVGAGLETNFWILAIKNAKKIYWQPWEEMLVTPFVVVEIVGIDLLRELGFVMILWPAHIYYSSTFQFMPNSGKWHRFDNCCQPHSTKHCQTHTWPFVEERGRVLTVGRFTWAGISHRQRLMVQPVLQGKY